MKLWNPDENNSNHAVSFEAAISPNPTRSDFKLSISNAINHTDKLQIRLMDLQGRLVKVYNGFSDIDGTFRFGSDLHAGVYIVEINQGMDKKVFRVIKL